VPTEAEISAFYDAVWKARRAGDVVLIKTLLYTGVRVAELVQIRLPAPQSSRDGRFRHGYFAVAGS